MKATIQVLVGPIASGKSSYSKNAARAGAIIVNDDEIVNLVHGSIYSLYDEKLKLLYKSVENHIVTTALAMGKIVVVDRGLNISKRGRSRWLSLAKGFDIPCTAVVFENEGPERHAQRRSQHDGRGHDYKYWLHVANLHASEYSLPSKDEGFTEISQISYDEITKGYFIP